MKFKNDVALLSGEFNINNIIKIYDDLKKNDFPYKKLQEFEFSQCLENYLWPNYNPSEEFHQCRSFLMFIVLMINEKFRERVPVWHIFRKDTAKFAQLFNKLTRMAICNANDTTNDSMTMHEQVILLQFFVNSFSSVEEDLIREQMSKHISPSIWLCISDSRREKEISQIPKLKKYFKLLKNKEAKMSEQQLQSLQFERQFLFNYIKHFLNILGEIPGTETMLDIKDLKYHIVFCERFMEFLIDLESMSLTRRFFNVLLSEMHVIIHCQESGLALRNESEGKLFNQLISIVKFYIRFEIDSLTGEELSRKDILIKHFEKISELQKLIFIKFPHLKDFYLSSASELDNRNSLVKHLAQLNEDELIILTKSLYSEQGLEKYTRKFLTELIIFSHEKNISQLDQLNETPLYPIEKTIWDENVVPSRYYNGESCLALPKLNLQFLSLHDYLLRNMQLFRLESTYEIRQDVEAAISRMKPWTNPENEKVVFSGWSRMAMPIHEFSIVDIGKPRLGEKAPSHVTAEICIALSVRKEVKSEWESLRKHDVCFLITVSPKNETVTNFNYNQPFVPQVGLVHVRGCEIEGMLDSFGRIVDENLEEKPHFDNDFRTFRVRLDPNQYAEDTLHPDCQVYESFNILMRRKPNENNFKAVLETIKDLMNTKCVVPDWLHDIILGYGNPSSAHYSELENRLKSLDFNDTFLDIHHLKQSFPNSKIFVEGQEESPPPYKLSFETENQIHVESYKPLSRGPYPHVNRKCNAVRFTPTQVEGIHSGMQPGLTLIVGPPGTGKTDVAVQIVSNLYHNFPNQRTLIVTHSNQALNQLFEKIMKLDIDERHLLRLGHGEEDLETEKDFTRYGRVNYVLNQRMYLLYEVGRLAKTLNVQEDVGYTCETAAYFYLHQVLSRFEQFKQKISQVDQKEDADFSSFFPFTSFFTDLDHPLFNGSSFEENLEIAKSCFRYIKRMFTQLEEFRAFEMLRTGSERSKYLLVKEAKIIAMTCTHAALKRKELVELGFQYDNILMEEAAQILEIETFIPVLLQNPENGHSRLKRWIMIGDHNQLPPVIKNTAFQKYSNMEQSLFTRLIRLGVPAVHLDAQGRSKPSICSLYRWKYQNLNDLAHVKQLKEFNQQNAGFAFDYQLIDVPDFNDVGESEPIPYFYQNLAEAEFIVALFMYMRLIGYPAKKISILTTYNGQKHLIRDVVEQRCASNPLIGNPAKITTVDKYQGQQNDYILLSLVRTKSVGHLRDVRRLIVSMSRARLGLYVFARAGLFSQCNELKPVFNLLCKRPTQLHLYPDEEYPNNLVNRTPANLRTFNEMPEMVQFVFDLFQQKLESWKKNAPEKLIILQKKEIITEEVVQDVEDPKFINQESEEFENEDAPFQQLDSKDKGIEDVVTNFDDEDF